MKENIKNFESIPEPTHKEEKIIWETVNALTDLLDTPKSVEVVESNYELKQNELEKTIDVTLSEMIASIQVDYAKALEATKIGDVDQVLATIKKIAYTLITYTHKYTEYFFQNILDRLSIKLQQSGSQYRFESYLEKKDEGQQFKIWKLTHDKHQQGVGEIIVITDRKITEVEQISHGGVIFSTKEEVAQYVERPLVKSMEILFDKGVRTFMSSANTTNNDANFSLFYDELSEENKLIVEQIKSAGHLNMSVGEITSRPDNKPLVYFVLDQDQFNEDEITSRSINIANQFVNQEAQRKIDAKDMENGIYRPELLAKVVGIQYKDPDFTSYLNEKIDSGDFIIRDDGKIITQQS